MNCKILIREEHHTAPQPLETETCCREAYVTGQPGIGKVGCFGEDSLTCHKEFREE